MGALSEYLNHGVTEHLLFLWRGVPDQVLVRKRRRRLLCVLNGGLLGGLFDELHSLLLRLFLALLDQGVQVPSLLCDHFSILVHPVNDIGITFMDAILLR